MKPVLLFDTIGLLVDGRKIRHCYQQNMAQIMTARYGKSRDFWCRIDQKIVEDWASYHADLNYSGDDGIADMHEGVFRVTRALFRLANIAEPPKPEITALAHELMILPCRDSVLVPDVRDILTVCQQKGYQLATFAYLLRDQLHSITASLPMLMYHIGADTVNQYEHDQNYFMKTLNQLKVSADYVTVLTRHPQTAHFASQAGLHAQVVQHLSASFIQTLER